MRSNIPRAASWWAASSPPRARTSGFYKTGEKRPFREFWRDGAPLVPAIAIPDFQPAKWLSRYEGTVV